MRPLVPALMFLTCGIAAGAGQVFKEISSDRFLSRAVLVDDGAFEQAELIKRAQSFTHEVSGRYSFAELMLARTRSELAAATDKGATEITYQWWIREYNSQRRKPFPVARITVARAQYEIEVRNKRGDILVLGSHTPRSISTAKGTYELLQVNAAYTAEDEPRWYRDPVQITAFVRSRKPLSSLDVQLWLELARLFGTKSLDLWAQEHHWFTEESGFPFVFPFLPAEKPPNFFPRSPASLFSCDGDIYGLHCMTAFHGAVHYSEYSLDGKPLTKRKP